MTNTARTSRRIVLATLGSLGDLHPYVAIALGLKSRGHEPILATSEVHRARVERQGLHFHPMRPHHTEFEDDPQAIARLMDRRRGTEVVLRELFVPFVRESYADLMEVVPSSDLLLTHSIIFAGPLIAAKTGVAWLSAVLQPMVVLSRHEGFVPPQLPAFRHALPLWPMISGPFLREGKRKLLTWLGPLREFREELGLPPGEHPIFEGAYAPDGLLVLFSEALARRQPDWPSQAVVTGFPFFDDAFAQGLPPEVEQFLGAGAPPIVFTLGSSAVFDAGRFYHESLDAARRLGRRALLLVGTDARNQIDDFGQDALAVTYAPHSAVFPRGAVNVHQGGIGTTGQALRAGRPMLVVPWAHDQFDNGERVRRLGIGRVLYRGAYRAKRVARELGRLLEDQEVARKACAVGERVRSDDGVGAACDVIEQRLGVR
jgi:UDP:flavonoid glycosyltransferase YjiC (YdhE family)